MVACWQLVRQHTPPEPTSSTRWGADRGMDDPPHWQHSCKGSMMLAVPEHSGSLARVTSNKRLYTSHSAEEICEYSPPPHTFPCEFGCAFCCEFCNDFSWSFEPSKKGCSGPEKLAPKFAQKFALRFAPPRGKSAQDSLGYRWQQKGLSLEGV